MSSNRKIALFEFDGTLTHGDSLPLYLREVTGWWQTCLGFMKAIILITFQGVGYAPDYRTAIKEKWIRFIMHNVSIEHAEAAAERLKGRIVWRQAMVERLKWHKTQGHTIAIATGALDNYIHVLLSDLLVDVVLATKLDIQNNTFTGELLGPNCVRNAKTECVKNWLAGQEYSESWGYGNMPHDKGMLALCTHQQVI
jgi:phosphatidylglycerophosphatase C